MKLPEGWTLVDRGRLIEIQNHNIIIQIYDARPSDIRIIDKRNPRFFPLYEIIDNILSSVDEITDDTIKIVENNLKKEVIKNAK